MFIVHFTGLPKLMEVLPVKEAGHKKLGPSIDKRGLPMERHAHEDVACLWKRMSLPMEE
jgi:hypothetical protein